MIDFKINNNVNPIAFTAIEYEKAEPLLKEVLGEAQMDDFIGTVEANKDNDLVDVSFYARGKKLSAYIGDAYYFHGYKDFKWKCYAPYQRPFESHKHFVDRVIKKMDKRTAELKVVRENQQNYTY